MELRRSVKSKTRTFATALVLVAGAAPVAGYAQYVARLSLSSDIQKLGPFSFSTNSPDVTLIKQGDVVSDISFVLGRVDNSIPGIPTALPRSSTESFTVAVGAEQLTFTFGGVFPSFTQPGQVGVVFHVDGNPVPYYDVNNNDEALITQQTDLGGNKATGLHFQFTPFYSDPAYSLLTAISQANGLSAPSSADRVALYSMNVGDISIAAVPEPATGTLLLWGVACVCLWSVFPGRA